jgi:hypothetical protein
MSGRPHIKITEPVESLREILKQQTRILAYNKVQMGSISIMQGV